MKLEANNPRRKSWVDVPENSDFPIQNLPFGIFSVKDGSKRVGTAIGNYVLDLSLLYDFGYIDPKQFSADVFKQEYLNELVGLGKMKCRELRERISELLSEENKELQEDTKKDELLVPMERVTMHLPVKVGDYTDFYSSEEHARNVGTMFRDPDNALLPNWKHLPVAYHGRSSSIVLSGVDIRRPKGQMKPDGEEKPVFGPCRLLDFELEMAFITHQGKPMGESISTQEAEDYIFGMVLFNDWSARDIQKWEYVPLGPFLAKNFASSISPWLVTLDALQPFATEGPRQDPEVLPYLQFTGCKNYDIRLEVAIQPEKSEETVVGQTNFRYMYWNMAQQLAHHTVNGCPVNACDLMASGTISGKEQDSFGSMLELSWKGTRPLKLKDGSERKFIQDGDTVIMRAHCKNENIRLGFGEVRTGVLPAFP